MGDGREVRAARPGEEHAPPWMLEPLCLPDMMTLWWRGRGYEGRQAHSRKGQGAGAQLQKLGGDDIQTPVRLVAAERRVVGVSLGGREWGRAARRHHRAALVGFASQGERLVAVSA